MTNTSLEAFFACHPVFTVEDVDRFLAARRGGQAQGPQTRQSLLGHYRRQGRLRRVRRGLYAVEVPGYKPGDNKPGYEEVQGADASFAASDTFSADAFSSDVFSSADPFLIAARLTPDAVLAYHTALQLHGFAHSIREEHVCLSRQKLVRPLRFDGVRYRAVLPPAALPEGDRMTLGVETFDRQGLPVRATGLERTLVDVLDRPALAGGWEEAWRSWEGVSVALDFSLLLRYARLLGSATTAAKLGYALEVGRERLAMPGTLLDELRLLAPRQPHPAERGLRQGTRLIHPWNLLVPTASLDEPSQYEPAIGGDWEQGEDWEEDGDHEDGDHEDGDPAEYAGKVPGQEART